MSSSCCHDQPEAHSLVVLRDTDGTLLVRAADLPKLRLKKPPRHAGRRWRALRAARPRDGRHCAVRRRAQRVHVSLPPAAFLPTRTVAQSPDVPQVTTASLGGFVNYDLYGEQVDRSSSLGTILDLASSAARRGDELAASRYDNEQREAVRLETTWTLDFPERLATLRVGDSVSAAARGALGALRRRAVRHQFLDPADARDCATPVRAGRGRRAVDGGRVRERQQGSERERTAGRSRSTRANHLGRRPDAGRRH